MSRLATFSLVLFGFGCGGPGTGPVPSGVAQSHCKSTCERDKMCDPNSTETVQACTDDCVMDVTSGFFREDAFVDIADCISALACTAEEDTCFKECSPTKAHTDYETKCRAKASECGGSGSGVDSLCEVMPTGNGESGFLCVVVPAAITEMAACFDLACDAVGGCLDTVYTKYGLSDG